MDFGERFLARTATDKATVDPDEASRCDVGVRIAESSVTHSVGRVCGRTERSPAEVGLGDIACQVTGTPALSNADPAHLEFPFEGAARRRLGGLTGGNGDLSPRAR